MPVAIVEAWIPDMREVRRCACYTTQREGWWTDSAYLLVGAQKGLGGVRSFYGCKALV